MIPRNGVSHRLGLLILLAIFSLVCMLFGYHAEAHTPTADAPIAVVGEYRLAVADVVRIRSCQSPAPTVHQTFVRGDGLNAGDTEKGLQVHRKGQDGRLQVVQPVTDEFLGDGGMVYVLDSQFQAIFCRHFSKNQP